MKTFGSEKTQGSNQSTLAKIKFDDSSWSKVKIYSLTRSNVRCTIGIEAYTFNIPSNSFDVVQIYWRSFIYVFRQCKKPVVRAERGSHRYELDFMYGQSTQEPVRNRLWLIDNGVTHIDGISVLSSELTCERLHEYRYERTPKKENRMDTPKLVFLQYTSGTAWYYCEKQALEEAIDDDYDICIYHLLTGKKYEADPYALTPPRQWGEVHESFRADALAANPEIKHYITGENPPMYEESTNGMFDFGRFGQMSTDQVVMSPKGLAIKFLTKNNQTKFRSWDKDKNVMTDVTGLTVPLNGMLFIMPSRKLEVGDIIDHEGEFSFIKEANDDGSYVLLGPSGELSQHIKTVSLMGYNFYRKVVTPMKRFGGDDGIMGMMKMNMMMSMMNGGGSRGGGMQQMLMMQMMGNGDSGFGDLFDFEGLFGDDEEGK